VQDNSKSLLVFQIAVYALALMAPLSRAISQGIAIIVLILGIWLWIRGQKALPLPRWESIFLVIFMALFIVSAFIGGLKMSSQQMGRTAVLFCIFPIIAYSAKLSKRMIVELLLWATVIVSLLAVYNYFKDSLDRAAALSSGYTTLALFEATMLPLGLVLFWQARGTRRWLYAATILIMALGLFLTQTRSGWLAALIGIIIVGYYLAKKATLITIIVVLAAVAILPQTRSIVEKRIEGDKPGGFTSGRAILWNYALTPLSHLPFFGYGPGSFTRLMPSEVLEKTGDLGIKSWHSVPLEILLESGPLALLAFLIFMGLALVRSWRGYFRARERQPINLGLFASIMVLYLSSLSTNILRDFILTVCLMLLWSLAIKPIEKNDDLQISQ
jgi:O-antigen ligase